MVFDVTSQQVDITLDIVFFSIGSFCLDKAEIDSILNRLALVGAIPTVGRVAPFEKFLSPAVEDVAMKLYKTLISRFGFINVIDTVSIGTEGIGHL